MTSRLQKRILVVSILTSLALATIAWRARAQSATDALGALGVAEPDARESFFQRLWGGPVLVPGGQKVFRAASPEKRVAIVRALGAFVKAYCNSDLFKKRYAQAWEANRPAPPQPPKVVSPTEQINREIAELRKAMKELPPDVEKQMEQTIAQLEAQRAASEDPATQAKMAAALKLAYEDDLQQYERRLKTYEAEHPKEPNAMIARRLKNFLDLSATVDFQARLVPKGQRIRFADPALEAKSEEWKLLFRAGKESVEAARVFAAEWLRELEAR